MVDYNDYLKYLKHVDDTTLQDIKAKENALKKETSDLKTKCKTEMSEKEKAHEEEKSKIEDAYKKEISNLKTKHNKIQKELSTALNNILKERDELSTALNNILKERDELLMNFSTELGAGVNIFKGIFLTIGFFLSLPLAGIPIFIYRKVKKRKVAKKLTKKYELVRQFYDKRAIVKLCGKYGYVNTSGKVVIPLKYDDAKDFKDKKAQVRYENKWIYINKLGVIQ